MAKLSVIDYISVLPYAAELITKELVAQLMRQFLKIVKVILDSK